MLNAYPLNSAPLNGLSGGALPETVVLQPGDSFVWSAVIKVAGVDVTDLCQGYGVSGNEDGDLAADFVLQLGSAPVDLRAFTGKSVTIDYVVHGDPVIVDRRFTGQLVEPEFDVLTRLLSCNATTRLEDDFEARELAEIDTFVVGWWSADVFEETAGRSRWDYTLERMSTRPASLNVDRQGNPRVTSWYPPGVAFEFAPGAAIYESVDVALAALSDTVNVYELEADYRYSRYRQRNQEYSWTHPQAPFELWRQDSTELPDVPMIEDATESAGWFVSLAEYDRLPGDLLDLPNPWKNKNTDLLLVANWTASKRWAQRGVEQYRIRLEVPEFVAAVGEVIDRARVVLDTESDGDSLWEGSGGDEAATDEELAELPKRDPVRLEAALRCAIEIGRVTILQSQRGSLVTWQVPLAHALGVDFGQRLRLLEGVTVTGTVASLSETASFETGEAVLTIGIAVSQGEASAVSDVLAIPVQPVFEDDAVDPLDGVLPTQLGNRSGVPEYNEELPGFAGNYSIADGDPGGLTKYPRRFAVDTPEIIAQWRDEVAAETAVTYRIAPPVDQLEI